MFWKHHNKFPSSLSIIWEVSAVSYGTCSQINSLGKCLYTPWEQLFLIFSLILQHLISKHTLLETEHNYISKDIVLADFFLDKQCNSSHLNTSLSASTPKILAQHNIISYIARNIQHVFNKGLIRQILYPELQFVLEVISDASSPRCRWNTRLLPLKYPWS